MHITSSILTKQNRSERLNDFFGSSIPQEGSSLMKRPSSQGKRVHEISETQSNRQSVVLKDQLSSYDKRDKNSVQRIKMKKTSSDYGSRESLKFALNIVTPNVPRTKGYFKFEEEQRYQTVGTAVPIQTTLAASQRLTQDLIKRTVTDKTPKTTTIVKKQNNYVQKSSLFDVDKAQQNVSVQIQKRQEESAKDRQKLNESQKNSKNQSQFVRSHTDVDPESPNVRSQGHRKTISKQIENNQTIRVVSPIIQEIATLNMNLDPSRFSSSKNGLVRNYAANTHQGLVRNYNEDRVSIIVNINQSHRQNNWPACSYFAVYDGHGGSNCSDFLRDNLHLYIIRDENFPANPMLAIQKGFEKAEQQFTALSMNTLNQSSIERSGSCAVSIIIVGDQCYIANVGDSRAILSSDGGRKVQAVTKDHKPTDESEKLRITTAGGRIYQSQVTNSNRRNAQPIFGPHRVFPGRLSVTRSFGDIEAKLEVLGGRKGVVIASPEIISFRISDNHDFLLLASDGIFDKLTNEDVLQAVWDTQTQIQQKIKVHEFGAKAVENVMKFSLVRKTLDNITVVLVGFNNFKRSLKLKWEASNQLSQQAPQIRKIAPDKKVQQSLDFKPNYSSYS